MHICGAKFSRTVAASIFPEISFIQYFIIIIIIIIIIITEVFMVTMETVLLKVGYYLKAVFPSRNLGLMRISSSRFKQSKNCSFVS